MLHFEWDPVKAKTNQRKHGVSFEEAARIFEDPHSISELDHGNDAGEPRWRVIGSIGGPTLLLIVHAVRERSGIEIIRIISARGADRKERRRYEQARAQDAG